MQDQLIIKRFYPFNKKDDNLLELGYVFKCLFKTNNFYQKKKLNFFFNSDTTEKLKKCIVSSKMVVLYVVLNNELISFITFEDSDFNEKEMQIFMTPNWRFKGYGLICLLMAEKFMLKRYKNLKSITAQPCNTQITSILYKANWFDCCDGDCGDFRKDLRL